MRYGKALAAGAATATLLGLLQGYMLLPDRPDSAGVEAPVLVRIDSSSVEYRTPGEFLSGGTPANAPLTEIAPERPFRIMERQVTGGEYQRCVADEACRPLDRPGDPALPLAGIDWDDAVAYAAWLSAATGHRYRLPTDREWAIAAGSLYRDDVYTAVSDPGNPSKRWLAVYEAEAARQEEIDPRPLPVGSFGRNENGLLDLAGNVWEWTSTCFERHRTDPDSGEVTVHENCGVRIAEGRHRAYMTSFIRDPKAGACSVGIPPANLGLRLVREEGGLAAGLRRLLRL